MAVGLFHRLLAKLRSGSKTSDLWTLATKGNVAARLRIAQEPKLDQRTLEILARRGPREVRLAVANHPALALATVAELRRVPDAEFQAALDERFTTAAEPMTPLQAPKDPFWGGAHESVEAAGMVVVPAAPVEGPAMVLEILKSDAPAVAPWDAVPLMPDSEAFGSVGLECRSLERVDLEGESLESLGSTDSNQQVEDSMDALPALSIKVNSPESRASEDVWWDDLECVLDQIADSVDAEPGADSPPWSQGQLTRDDVAELKLIRVFEMLPSGASAEALLVQLATNQAPQIRSLMRLRDEGWGADEISLVWHVRSLWNEQYGAGVYGWPLDYWTVATLVNTYTGFPDEEQVLSDLEALRDAWKCAPSYGGRLALNGFIRDWVADYEKAYQGSTHPPIDLVLRA